MSKRTNYNSIYFLTSLGVYLVLAFVLTAFPVLGQKDAQINKKPLEDFAEMLRREITRGETDFDKPFLVEAEFSLTNDGKIDAAKSKFVRSEGDARMSEIAENAITAIGDGGFFSHLKNFGIDKFSFSMQQTDKTFSSVIKAEQQTAERAKTLASGFRMLIEFVLMNDNRGSRKLDDNSRALVTNTKVTTEEKNVILNFSMPKADFHAMIFSAIQKATTENKKNVQS